MQIAFLNIGTAESFLLLVIFLSIVIVYFYCLFHAATNIQIPGVQRLLWFLIILSLPLLGSIAYWYMGRGRQAKARTGAEIIK